MERLYIITRSDLPPGARAAQSCHGLAAFSARHPELYQEWYDTSNNIILLEEQTEETLRALMVRAEEEGIPHAPFREPDFDDALTALALSSEARRLVSNLPLTLRTAG